MEDLSGSMAQDSQLKNIGRMLKAQKSWTFLLIGDLGKIVSFRLTTPALLVSTTCLTAILAVVIYSMVSYNLVRLENKRLRNNLDTLGTKLETTEKDKEKALVGLMVLKNGTKPSSVATEGAEPEALKTAQSPAQPEKDKAAELVSPARMSVDNLKIWQEPDESDVFKYQFALKNIDRESGKIPGYTFLVFKPKEGSGESHRAFPWTPLKDGVPGIVKRGQYFSIARFKFVRGTLTDVNTIDRFKVATIYVYSYTGDLLVKKVFDMAEIFKSHL
ncbi:MAG: hypothetical protein HWN69_07650 [Desulfobacterales bacterium]|nr:hypothetical protein [Desulfobacterales bacterium]